MKELTYEQLSESQQELAAQFTQAAGRSTPWLEECGTSLFLVDSAGLVVGYRLAEMFASGKPVKWGKPLHIATHEPLLVPPEKPKKARATIMRASSLVTENKRILIVACGRTKKDTSAGPVPARELYVGQLFCARRGFAESSGVPWVILSAAHGLIEPSVLLSRYDKTVPELTEDERSNVQLSIVNGLIAFFGSEDAISAATVEVHGGADYVELVREVLSDCDPKIVTPVAGMGIGQQLAFYRGESEQSEPASANGTRMVKRELIFPSPLNPRKNFELEYLGQLAASLESQGVLNDLIVRPRKGGAPGELEIAAGECRWRASEMAGIEELPVKIRDLSDAEMLALMLVENMKRKDLTTIEESDAFNLAMAQKNTDGTPVYATIEAFAKQIGEKRVYVQDRIRLRKLPAIGRTALGCGDISFKTAQRVCALPEALVGKLLEVVLKPWKHIVEWSEGRRCMTADEAESYKREHVVRELRDTAFCQTNATLLPAEIVDGQRVRGGACSDCPWNSAVQAKEEESEPAAKAGRGRPRGDGRWCLNPECFAKKLEIHTAAALVKAKEEGCDILSADEAAKILYDDGTVKSGAHFVRLDLKPESGEHNDKIPSTALPTWGAIVRGEATAKIVTGHTDEGDAVKEEVSGEVEVPTVAAVTARGHVVKLVKREVAVAAAQKRGTAHFLSLSAGGGRSLMVGEIEDRKSKERAEQKLRNEVSFAAMGALVGIVEETEDSPDAELFVWLVEIAMWHGSNDAVQFVCKRRGISGDDLKKELLTLAKRSSIGQRLALALELLAARPVKFNGVSDDYFKRLAGIYQVDVAKIDKEIRKAAKEKAEGKKQKAKAAKGEEGAV